MKTELNAILTVPIPDDFPRNKSGIIWAKINPERRVDYLETEAKSLRDRGGQISQKWLNENGLSWFMRAVNRFYPGKLGGLNYDLGHSRLAKPPNFWVENDPIAVIKQEASDVLAKEGRLTRDFLEKNGRGYLRKAIEDHFPGGWDRLKQELGADDYKPDGYWTPERIRQQATEFLHTHPNINNQILFKLGNSALGNAINKQYPGGWSKLREDVGLENRKPKGYWADPINVQQEAIRFYQEYGGINGDLLRKHRRSSLAVAASKYPGGLWQLREDIGVGQPANKDIDFQLNSQEVNMQLGQLLEVRSSDDVK